MILILQILIWSLLLVIFINRKQYIEKNIMNHNVIKV
jgi:hypothetical protein